MGWRFERQVLIYGDYAGPCTAREVCINDHEANCFQRQDISRSLNSPMSVFVLMIEITSRTDIHIAEPTATDEICHANTTDNRKQILEPLLHTASSSPELNKSGSPSHPHRYLKHHPP
jgi:hypothetical protein